MSYRAGGTFSAGIPPDFKFSSEFIEILIFGKLMCGGTRYEGSVVYIFSLKHGDRDRGRVLKTPPFYLSLSLFLSPNIRVSLAAKITNLDILQTSKRIVQLNPPKILPLGCYILKMRFATSLASGAAFQIKGLSINLASFVYVLKLSINNGVITFVLFKGG